MPTTSSPTSNRRWDELNPAGLATWLTLATILVVVGFAAQTSGDSNPDLFYEYGLALSSVVIYGILIGLTLWAGSAYGNPLDSLGLRAFSAKWMAVAVGLIFLLFLLAIPLERVLHAGEEQGYAPDVWRPERATAYFVNGV